MKQAIGFALLFLVVSPSVARAQGSSSVTYQGRLNDGAGPATGSYDLQFKIFPVATGGVAYWQTSITSVPVSGGLFTVALGDALNPLFPGLFDGSERWLEIGVRPAGSPNPHTALSPRQALTSAPNALFSSTTGDPNVQRRTVPPACPAGQYVRSLAADGTPTCVADATGSGTVTAVTAGAGLSGGTVTTAGTLSVDFTAVAAASHSHALSGEVTGTLISATVSNAVSANTADAIVRRDPSGNFSAGTITANALSAATTSTAGAFNYSAPLSSSYMVSECAFVERSGLGVRCGLGDGAAPEVAGTSGFGLGAPVNLPHGAVITAVTFYVLDNDPTLDLFVLLSTSSPATGPGASPIAFSLTAGANSAVQAITTSGLSVIVDNTVKSYGVNVFTTPSAWPGAASNPNLRIYGARIDYTMARPAR